MKTKMRKLKKGFAKKWSTLCMTLVLLSASASNVYAAAPSGVDQASYNALVDIVFWLAGIAVAAAGAVPSVIRIVQGQTDEDPRGRNAGIAGLVITGAGIGVLITIKTLLF